MLKQLLSTTAIALGVVGFVSTASAADLPMKPVKLVSYEKQKDFDGFYLRGDIGYAIPNSPGTSYGPGIQFVKEDLSDAWLVGGGIGYPRIGFYIEAVCEDQVRGANVDNCGA